MDNLNSTLKRNKSMLALISLGVFAVTVLLSWSINPSDELAARFLRYVLDRGREVYRLDGSVREVTKESVNTISVTDCRRMKADIFICAMRFSDRAGEEYLAAFEASWQRGSVLTNVDDYRVVGLSLEQQREILVERKMLQP